MNSWDSYKNQVFQRAKTRGFTDCELYSLSGSTILLGIPAGEEYSGKMGVALRATIGAKTGSAYTENLSEQSIDFLLDSALENASLAPEAPADYCEPGLAYPSIANQDPELVDMARVKDKRAEICAQISRCPILAKTTGNLHAIHLDTRVANTRGLDVRATASYVYCDFFGVAERDGVLKDTLLYRQGAHLADIDAPALLDEASQRAARYFGAAPVKTGKYNILFSNNTASYLVQGFSVFFSAEAARRGLSLWKDKLGQPVASPCVTVIDDPLDTRGAFTRPFDAEGYPAGRRVLIENGVLRSYLHSAATARAEPGALPGSTWRLDLNYEPAIHPSNLYLAPGEKSFAGLLEELGDGLYVTDMTAYFHGAGINAVSGDYSMPVTGFLVKNGRVDRPVDGVTIAGNLYQLLGQVSRVGNDFLYGLPTSFRPGAPMGYGCYGSPSMIVKDISVGGL